MKISPAKIIRFILLTALATAALAVAIPVFLFDRFTIRGDSLLPTLHDGTIWTIKDYGPLYIPAAGDNVLNSRDSRYIGLIPEAYIVGIAAGNN